MTQLIIDSKQVEQLQRTMNLTLREVREDRGRLDQLQRMVEQNSKEVREDRGRLDQVQRTLDQVLKELREDRENNDRRWEKNDHRWEENDRRWEENNQKWEENNSRWEENDQKWAANRQEFEKVHKRMDAFSRKLDGLGARWGINTEAAFRNALKAILEESFGIKVENFEERDNDGFVIRDRPIQVELDVIIKNGLVIVCEIKSSVSATDINIFERKVRFYEKNQQRQADRMIVISPMVHERAKARAKEYGIEVYSDSEQVKVEG